MIKKYRKKPVVIEAIQFTESNKSEVLEFITVKTEYHINNNIPYIVIPTLEGNHNAQLNDFIIKGIQGEFYPCKPDIFEKTYEEV